MKERREERKGRVKDREVSGREGERERGEREGREKGRKSTRMKK